MISMCRESSFIIMTKTASALPLAVKAGISIPGYFDLIIDLGGDDVV
jgi:hypothetical protein